MISDRTQSGRQSAEIAVTSQRDLLMNTKRRRTKKYSDNFYCLRKRKWHDHDGDAEEVVYFLEKTS